MSAPLMDDFSSDHRELNAKALDVVQGAGQGIAIEHHEVCLLSHLE